MPSYVLEGPKWGTAPLGAGGGTVSWSFADPANGHRFFDWDAAISGEFRTEVENAFARWQSVADIRFAEVPDSPSVNIRLAFDTIDGVGGVAGETQYTYDSSSFRFQAAEIRFDDDEGWHLQNGSEISARNVSFFALALHEIGHAIGLGHYNAGPAVMNATLTASLTDLMQSDTDGIAALYGPPPSVGSVAINDLSIIEGNSGTKNLIFTVTRTGGTAAFSVDYATADATASAGQDYAATSGTLQFAVGDTAKTVAVAITGDTIAEPNEYFYVDLSNATNGATIASGRGVGTIFDDDSTVFDAGALRLAGFSQNVGGWTSQGRYPRALADVSGDGKADIVGFGEAGVFVAGATGSGNFAAPIASLVGFGASVTGGGWVSQDSYPRRLADVDGDGKADIVGFGAAGAFVALASGDGNFAAPILATANFGAAPVGGGWYSDDRYPRRLADVNGDGKADIVGFGEGGVFVALASGGGNFAAPVLGLANFGASASGGGWYSDDRYPRRLADVNGDGKADIVGFGEGGVFVALASGGGNFAAPILALANFGAGSAGGGWYSDDRYPRLLADVNGDDRADIIGFGEDGAWVAHGNASGTFGSVSLASANFGASSTAGGWTSADTFPRLLADIDGDGKDDLAGFGYGGVSVALSHDMLAALAAT
jgi:hypothetical protein